MSVFKGDKINIEITGSSHGEEMRLKMNGIPSFSFDREILNDYLQRRKPSGDFQTERRESDIPEFKKGIVDGRVVGEIEVVVNNQDVKKEDYAELYGKPRPSHADYCRYIKDGSLDFSGGGRFSGRLTVLYCVAGAIASSYLKNKGIKVESEIISVGKAKKGNENFNEEVKRQLSEAKKDGDSLGAVVKCVAKGVPAGLGNDYFQGMESKISSLVYAIPGVKGVEFGKGFAISELRGSEANDEWRTEDGKIFSSTNNSGGINGGITNGMDVELSVAFRPTPSIAKKQKTVDLKTGENTEIEVKGRHDVCFALRTLPIVESALAIAILDEILKDEETKSIENYRAEIDKIDDDIKDLFLKRMEISRRIGRLKAKNGEKVYSLEREKAILERLCDGENAQDAEKIKKLYSDIFYLSRKEQEKI